MVLRAECMSRGEGDRDEVLARPLAAKIKLNKISIKKSSIGGSKYRLFM